jgi:hypothetical protein
MQQLKDAGRQDLVYGVALHGHAAVCQQLQLPARSRGLVKRRLQFAHVAGALLGGARTPSEVLRHLQTTHGYAVARSYLNQKLLDWRAEGRVAKFKHGHYCLPAHAVLRLRREAAAARAGGAPAIRLRVVGRPAKRLRLRRQRGGGGAAG